VKDEERQGLLRDLSEALAALQQDKIVPTLDGLADHLVRLGGPYRFHGVLIKGALRRTDPSAIMAQLIQVLDKVKRGVK
jgi:hypothetical protein